MSEARAASTGAALTATAASATALPEPAELTGSCAGLGPPLAASTATPAATTATTHRPIHSPLLRRIGVTVIAPAAEPSVERIEIGVVDIGVGIDALGPRSIGSCDEPRRISQVTGDQLSPPCPNVQAR